MSQLTLFSQLHSQTFSGKETTCVLFRLLMPPTDIEGLEDLLDNYFMQACPDQHSPQHAWGCP